MPRQPKAPAKIRLTYANEVLHRHEGAAYYSTKHRCMVMPGDYVGDNTCLSSGTVSKYPNLWVKA